MVPPSHRRPDTAGALGYPGRALGRPILLTSDGERPLDAADLVVPTRLDGRLRAAGGSPWEHRRLVVAVGSNASLATIRAKLRWHRTSPVLPLVPGILVGVSVGHSAHVSLGGYVAAAPYDRPGGAVRVAAGWFDDDQLRALDGSEPNYRRARLPTSRYPLSLLHLDPPPEFEVYRSVWGVLTVDDRVLPLRAQRSLHRVLASDPWLARRVPLADSPSAVRALRDRRLQVEIRRHWARSGRAGPDGLVVLG